MMILKQTGAVALGLAAVLLMGQFPLAAQEAAVPKSTSSTPKKQDRSRRVPPYFGQIGLSSDQRASIYALQAKRFEKIDALEKQIATEKAEMHAECEALLTETQKKLFENLQKGSSELAPKPTASSKP